jgi:hypothetical protein
VNGSGDGRPRASASGLDRGRVSSTSLRVLIPVVIGVPGCFAAGWFELTRALGGREIAWVYTFEWPLYGVAGLYMWRRIWHPSIGRRTRAALLRGDPAPVRTAHSSTPDDDPELAAWQHYLDKLHAADPPGGPPPRPGSA